MVTPAPNPLSPRELELLTTFVVVDYDLQALVDRLKLSPQEILDFLESAPIRARLHSVKRFTDLADHLFCSRRRRSAIRRLDEILTTTQDPVERRRAATAILRFTSLTPRRNAAPAPRSTDAESSPSSLRRPVPRSLSPSAPLRADSSPESISLALTSAIARGEASAAFSTLREVLTPDATLNGEPMPADPQAFSPRCADHSPIAPLAETVGLIPIGSIGDDRQVQEELIAVPGTAPRLSTTLTYLDHAGRARLTATYGGGSLTLGTGLDPVGFEPDSAVPAAAELLAQGLTRPLTLTEMIYGPGGEMTERRDYDVTWNGTGDPPYHAELQFTGQGGNIVFRQAPGSGAEVSTVDGLGRIASSATVVPRLDGSDVLYDFEIARTDHVYDADSNLQQIKRWERIVDADSTNPADPELGPDNAVLTRTFNWHDVNKRLIATAELGAMDNDGTPSAYLSAGGGVPSTPAWFDPQDRPSINIAGQAVVRLDVPATIPLTIYHFDRRGNQSHIASPSGAVTAFTYTGTGKVAEKLENAFSLAGHPPRSTRYTYRFGRLAEVLADRLDSANPQVQRTYLTFGANEENNGGARVVDIGPDGTLSDIISAHGGHVADMILIDESADPLEADPFFTFRYDFLGRIAERIDARGVVLRYRYDALDRLSTVEVGHYNGEGAFEPEHPAAMNEPVPADRIGYVTYSYANDMNTFEVRAYTSKAASQLPPPGNLPIAATKMEFDARGRLIKDWQSLGRPVSSNTPRTSYAWDTEHTGTPAGNPGWPIGHTRLDAMTYPTPPGGSSTDARIVQFGYGAAGTPDDLQSRIAAIATTQPDTLDIAAFAHIGSGRRARMELAGGALVQDFGLDDEMGGNDAIGLHGIDALGRIADLHWRQGPWDAPGDTLARVEYSHDVEGNRLSALRTPRPLGGLVSGTSEHQDNSYDALNRLITCDVEHDDGSTTTEILADAWDLDLLGNWVERTTGPPADPLVVSHEVNDRNEITQITLEPFGGSPQEFDVRYDAAGNLAFDGTFAYQYDAWNRLLAVNHAELDGEEIILAELVKHFTYDGLGRLARVQSPWPTPFEQEDGEVRTERFFYDGIRRVQEIVSDPVQDSSSAAMGGESAAIAAFAEEPNLDGSAITAASEANQVEEGGGGGGSAAMGGGGEIITYLEREYVWGPGDRGVDELLAQFDRGREPWWAVQDAGLDAIALCDLGGTPTSHFPNGTARVVAQFGYDAYGSVVTAESLFAHALVRAGHKGLFFDRLDLGVADPLSLEETPRLAVGADLLGNARNRVYSPRLGRWVQRDPNAMGSVLVASDPTRTAVAMPPAPGFDLEENLRDGPMLYGYVRHRMWAGTDPIGLYDAEDAYDDVNDFMGLLDPLPGFSDFVRGAIESLTQQYAANLEWDVHWAGSFSSPDEMQTRLDNGWIIEAIAEGAMDAFTFGIPFTDLEINPFRDLATKKDGDRGIHGDLELHHLPIQRKMRNLKRQFPGATGFEWNKALRDKHGNILRTADGRILKPDIQFWYRGKLYVYEKVNTNRIPNRAAAIKDVLTHNKIHADLKFDDNW